MKNKIVDARTISIIMPTRKRTGNLIRLINSVLETCRYPENIEMCIRVDYDDKESALALISFSDRIGVKISIGARQKCHGYYWNGYFNCICDLGSGELYPRFSRRTLYGHYWSLDFNGELEAFKIDSSCQWSIR